MSPFPKPTRRFALGALTATAIPLLSELRGGRSDKPLTDAWSTVPVELCGHTQLGISFRPRQAEDFGLDVRETLDELLGYPFDVIRLSAYWDRMEPVPGGFDTAELDWQLDAAEAAGKDVIMCLGPTKSFGYPEYFVPHHRLPAPLPEGRLIDGATHPDLLDSASDQLTRLVERYRDRSCIRAWQVEHEAVDPLGMEHSWRLASTFLQHEVAAVRSADPTRPIVLNGFLPTSTAVLAQQWWRTRDQGDSLAVAKQLADVVGIDFYPRHAAIGAGRWSLYLDGAHSPFPVRARQRLLDWAGARKRELMVTEGQAEPWEAVTVPPSTVGRSPSSCPPERIIQNYNTCMRWRLRSHVRISAYVFWGAEYWVTRLRAGDRRYMDAFARVLEQS